MSLDQVVEGPTTGLTEALYESERWRNWGCYWACRVFVFVYLAPFVLLVRMILGIIVVVQLTARGLDRLRSWAVPAPSAPRGLVLPARRPHVQAAAAPVRSAGSSGR